MFFLSWLYWNPKKELFVIPYLNVPILWYSVLFAVGFLVGYYIFFTFLKRFFLNFPLFKEGEVRSFDLLEANLKDPKDHDQKLIAQAFRGIEEESDQKKKKMLLANLNNLFSKKIDFKFNCKVKGVQDPKKALFRLFLEKTFPNVFTTIKDKTAYVSDKITIYMVVSTIIGARLGHLIFYEDFSYYLSHPLKILKTWDGGLASHGAAIAILIALFILSRKLKNFYPKLSFLTLLDLVSVPTAFAAVCIRIGNFFNQEILGKPTQKAWGIIFGSPMENGAIVPRHPAQLYEASFYLILFFVLLYFSFKPKIYLKNGRLIGMFLFFVFTFRFIIEFLKIEQSVLLSSSFLLMGQYLSIPFIILGIFLFFRKTDIQKG